MFIHHRVGSTLTQRVPRALAAGGEAVTPTNIDTAVVEAIRLLEAKDHKTFLTQFVPPDQLKDLAGTSEAFDTLVKTFPPRGERILTALKSVRTQKPTYDAAKPTATFQVEQPASDRGRYVRETPTSYGLSAISRLASRKPWPRLDSWLTAG